MAPRDWDDRWEREREERWGIDRERDDRWGMDRNPRDWFAEDRIRGAGEEYGYEPRPDWYRPEDRPRHFDEDRFMRGRRPERDPWEGRNHLTQNEPWRNSADLPRYGNPRFDNRYVREDVARDYRENTYQERPSFRGRGPKNFQRSDERLHELVCERLEQDDLLDASNIEVTVEGSEVRLSGTVPARHQKRRAEDLAEEIAGVRNVANMLRIDEKSDVPHHDIYKSMKNDVDHMETAADTGRVGVAPTTEAERTPPSRRR